MTIDCDIVIDNFGSFGFMALVY